jgi:hypothetical protein
VIYALRNANKLEPRGKNRVFVNYNMDTRSYQIWDPKEDKVKTTCDVNFLKDRNKGEKANPIFLMRREPMKWHVLRYRWGL